MYFKDDDLHSHPGCYIDVHLHCRYTITITGNINIIHWLKGIFKPNVCKVKSKFVSVEAMMEIIAELYKDKQLKVFRGL